MQVKELMSTELQTVEASDSARKAAEEMEAQNIGSVLVTKEGKLEGILTDRDIVLRTVAHGKDAQTCLVGECCSKELDTLSPDDEIERAIEEMRVRSIRRLPVTEDGKAVGMLSLGDLARERDPDSVLGQISRSEPNN